MERRLPMGANRPPMDTLIVKLGATGDVVRTTPLLRRLAGRVTWLTASKNVPLLGGLQGCLADLRVIDWQHRSELTGARFDLVINLEDDPEAAGIVDSVATDRLFGAYAQPDGRIAYTADASQWFDLSLISVHGRRKADELKFRNRRSYQELLFEGLDLQFAGDEYVLPPSPVPELRGDVAIAPDAGPVWPMKKWAHYDWLKRELEARSLTVHYLPTRATLIEHLADVRGHRCLVSGDSLPMHLALGSRLPCVALFNCTSPWEIHDYGILAKLVSPLLGEYFYRREFDSRATEAIPRSEVLSAVLEAVARSPCTAPLAS
jgi:heptosyltransferase-2